MTNLIIHPSDPTTSFLDIVYAPIPNKTVITGGMSQKDLRKLIPNFDRILMMGHGTPDGLLSVGQFDSKRYIIDYTFVSELRKRENNVFIWCNADQFVNKFKLKGFFTGMFISETKEAEFCGLPGTDQEIVDESNYTFCNVLAKNINEERTDWIYDEVFKVYGMVANENPVAFYNHNRLYLK